MSTYVISDIHGCYTEFMTLIERIQFNPDQDTLYVLGDAIDRGECPIDCLRYIMRTKSVHYILGNHDQMMLEYFDTGDGRRWARNGCHTTLDQTGALDEEELKRILVYLRKRPLYKTVNVNGRRFFLSHAGLDPSLPFSRQLPNTLTWSREEFYTYKALDVYICVFGHTTTPSLREDVDDLFEHYEGYYNDCSIWLDTIHNDKICIDTACIFGGALSALRLDDGAVFYVKACPEHGDRYNYTDASIPDSFFKAVD